MYFSKNNYSVLLFQFLTLEKMKIVILIAEAYQFGDIIAFEGKLYKHYGVYVGTTEFSEKKLDEDYFHFTGKISKLPNLGHLSESQPKCVFGSLKNENKHELDNYLDGILYSQDELKKDEKNMKSQIEEKYGATEHALWTNNCEHLATCCGRRLASHFVQNPGVDQKLIKQLKEAIKGAQGCSCPFIDV
uniref:LRAT domain-containing protein n=1 Tax=Nothobranchius furzeri TaxID=105023 RepID=A0A8C6LMI7_NOTFU